MPAQIAIRRMRGKVCDVTVWGFVKHVPHAVPTQPACFFCFFLLLIQTDGKQLTGMQIFVIMQVAGFEEGRKERKQWRMRRRRKR